MKGAIMKTTQSRQNKILGKLFKELTMSAAALTVLAATGCSTPHPASADRMHPFDPSAYLPRMIQIDAETSVAALYQHRW
jgi:hypothetical protein